MGYGYVRGGVRGTGTKLNQAMERVLATTISTTAPVVTEKYHGLYNKRIRLFDGSFIYWDVAQKREEAKDNAGWVSISPEYEEIVRHHVVPVDINIYNSFNARRQDLYVWAVRRARGANFQMNFQHRSEVIIPYDKILPQFFDNVGDRRVKPQQKAALQKDLFEITKVYPELNIKTDGDNIILMPSRLHIDEAARGFVQG
jgi:hypothetical protein